MVGRKTRSDVLVLGAGVIGLTTAVRLLERGHRVKVCATARTPGTTSDAAAALFFPYALGAHDRTSIWLRTSFSTFSRLAHDPETGVQTRHILELRSSSGVPEADWRTDLLDARAATIDELPPPHQGLAYGGFLIEMPRYLPWLERRVQALGGRLETRRVENLLELLGEADLVMNCTGLGARDLVPDPDLYALRGETLRVAEPGGTRTILDVADPTRPPTYVIPRSDGVIVGGTARPHDETPTFGAAAEGAILERAARLEPRIAHAPVLERRVGLRPGRGTVRLETEILEGLRLVHHYGHGGAGVTLSWGSADDAADLAEQHARQAPPPPRRARAPARLYTDRAHRRPAR